MKLFGRSDYSYFCGDFNCEWCNIFVYAREMIYLRIEQVLVIAANIITNNVEEFEDAFTTATDQIVLEFDTFENLSVSNESGSIQKVFVSNGGGHGYTKLPTVSVTSTSGQNAVLSATTENIGAVKSIQIMIVVLIMLELTHQMQHLISFVLKDVSGTFANGNTLHLILEL